jgi:hypothetical protein
MKITLASMLAIAFVLPFVATGADQDHGDADTPFLQANTWWNLYFSKENNPLNRGIVAVKILGVDEKRPSWVKIAFPKKREEHYSIFGPAAKAHDNEDISLEAALAKWEKTVTEWKVIWVNLDYVVHMAPVEAQASAPAGASE